MFSCLRALIIICPLQRILFDLIFLSNIPFIYFTVSIVKMDALASTSAEEKESDLIEKVGVAAEQNELKIREDTEKEQTIAWFETQLHDLDKDEESRHDFFSLPSGETDEKEMHSIYEEARGQLLKCQESPHDPRIMPLLNLMDKNYRLEREVLKKQQTEETKQAEEENEADSILNAMKSNSSTTSEDSSLGSEDEVKLTRVQKSDDRKESYSGSSDSSLSSSDSDSDSDSGPRRVIARRSKKSDSEPRGANIRKSKRVKSKNQNEDFVYHTRSTSPRFQQKLPDTKRMIQRTRTQGKSKVAAAKAKQQLKHSKTMQPKKKIPDETLETLLQNAQVVSPGGKVRRATKSRPSSISNIKDRVSRPKFNKCARQVSELHGLTTFAKKEDRDRVPKSQHFMYSYDELVEKPHYAKLGVTRDTPLSVFFAPEGVDVKALGQILTNVGKEMMKNNGRNKGKNYVVTNDKDAYSNLIFGEKMTKKNKSSRNIANL